MGEGAGGSFPRTNYGVNSGYRRLYRRFGRGSRRGWLEVRRNDCLLALIWASFVITLAMHILAFSFMIFLLSSFIPIFNYDLKTKSNSITISSEKKKIEFRYDHDLIEFEPLDIIIPALNIFYVIDEKEFKTIIHFFSGSVGLPPPELIEDLLNIEENDLSNSRNFAQETLNPLTITRNLNPEEITSILLDIANGMTLMMNIFSIFMNGAGLIGQQKFTIGAFFGLLASFIATIYYFYRSNFASERTVYRIENGTTIITFEEQIAPGISLPFILGITIGLLIVFLFNDLLIGADNLPWLIAKLGLIFTGLGGFVTLIGIIIAELALGYSDFALIFTIPQVIIAFGLLSAGTVNIFLTKDDIRDKIAKFFSGISISLCYITFVFFILVIFLIGPF
ncbi:MAG: hypothetical protein ACTSRG_27040 [Candidatus Helarchaeota archaeon]